VNPEQSTERKALDIAMRALQWYGDPKNWSTDDWNIRAVIASPDYSHERAGGQKARNALRRIARLTETRS